jgi:hypothetical protein
VAPTFPAFPVFPFGPGGPILITSDNTVVSVDTLIEPAVSMIDGAIVGELETAIEIGASNTPT